MGFNGPANKKMVSSRSVIYPQVLDKPTGGNLPVISALSFTDNLPSLNQRTRTKSPHKRMYSLKEYVDRTETIY